MPPRTCKYGDRLTDGKCPKAPKKTNMASKSPKRVPPKKTCKYGDRLTDGKCPKAPKKTSAASPTNKKTTTTNAMISNAIAILNRFDEVLYARDDFPINWKDATDLFRSANLDETVFQRLGTCDVKFWFSPLQKQYNPDYNIDEEEDEIQLGYFVGAGSNKASNQFELFFKLNHTLRSVVFHVKNNLIHKMVIALLGKDKKEDIKHGTYNVPTDTGVLYYSKP